MPIKATCSACGAGFTAPDASTDKTGRCLKCKAAVTIPAPSPASKPPTAPETYWEAVELVESVELVEAVKPIETPKQKTYCPFCDEEIKPAAVKCRHCGELWPFSIASITLRTNVRNCNEPRTKVELHLTNNEKPRSESPS